MHILKFKTNIKCGACIDTVTPFLNQLPGVLEWSVDTSVPDKILSIETADPLNPKEVMNSLDKAGYKAEKI